MNLNLLSILIFLLVLVGLLWAIPLEKVVTIGDFIQKIITPVAIPLSVALSVQLGFDKYTQWKTKGE